MNLQRDASFALTKRTPIFGIKLRFVAALAVAIP